MKKSLLASLILGLSLASVPVQAMSTLDDCITFVQEEAPGSIRIFKGFMGITFFLTGMALVTSTFKGSRKLEKWLKKKESPGVVNTVATGTVVASGLALAAIPTIVGCDMMKKAAGF